MDEMHTLTFPHSDHHAINKGTFTSNFKVIFSQARNVRGDDITVGEIESPSIASRFNAFMTFPWTNPTINMKSMLPQIQKPAQTMHSHDGAASEHGSHASKKSAGSKHSKRSSDKTSEQEADDDGNGSVDKSKLLALILPKNIGNDAILFGFVMGIFI